MLKHQAIEVIESLFPADSDFPETSAYRADWFTRIRPDILMELIVATPQNARQRAEMLKTWGMYEIRKVDNERPPAEQEEIPF